MIDPGAGADVIIFEENASAGSTLLIRENSGSSTVYNADADYDIINLTALDLMLTQEEFFDTAVTNTFSGTTSFDLGDGNSLYFIDSDLSEDMFVL